MSVEKKLKKPVTLVAQVEQKLHEDLRRKAFKERRSIGDLTRAALRKFIKEDKTKSATK